MQDFITIASGEDMMKYVFIGIFIFVAFIVNILKMLSIKNKEEGGASSKSNEDMAQARRRLQEMMREREAQRGFFEPVYEQESPVFEAQESYEEPEVLLTKAENPKENLADSAYSQNVFDYDTQLEATKKLLAESEIAYEKVAKNSTKSEGVAEDNIDIKATEIRDFVHNKTLLKKSIVIAEILDKPLSLR